MKNSPYRMLNELTKAFWLLTIALAILLSGCDTIPDDISRRSVTIARLLTGESGKTAELAKAAGWPEGTDPQKLLDTNGPHVSLVFIKNGLKSGKKLTFTASKKELLNKGERKRVTVQVREEKTRTGVIIATIKMVYHKDSNGIWVLAAIDTDA